MRSSAAAFEAFLQAHWTDGAMFLNFMESEQLSASAVGLVVSGVGLSEETLSPLLRAQAATMVVRGAVREEYEASMELSRT